MKFGSICSGIEAASVAWKPLGFEPSWFAEIDKFPSAVLKFWLLLGVVMGSIVVGINGVTIAYNGVMLQCITSMDECYSLFFTLVLHLM